MILGTQSRNVIATIIKDGRPSLRIDLEPDVDFWPPRPLEPERLPRPLRSGRSRPSGG
jgi:hypothetical protein